jgi:hypothetical protein
MHACANGFDKRIHTSGFGSKPFFGKIIQAPRCGGMTTFVGLLLCKREAAELIVDAPFGEVMRHQSTQEA